MANSTFADNYGGEAGAIGTWKGSLTVNNSTFASNIARRPLNPTTAGGGIVVAGPMTKAQITNSTFLENSTTNQGGAICNSSTTLKVTNSTLYGNNASLGGGIVNTGEGILELTNCTLYGNDATDGGGIRNYGVLTLRNTIVAGSAGKNCSNTGRLIDSGYNVEDADTCGFSKTNHSLVKTDPLLSPPGNYSGYTWTLALLPNSPAIDMIPFGTNGCGTDVASDQRGVQRPQGIYSECDAGAFESRGFTLQKISGDHQSSGLNRVFSLPLRVLVSSPYGEPVANGQIIFSGPQSGASTKPAANTAAISMGGSVIQSVIGNATNGRYWVTGGATGVDEPVYFDMTNVNGH